MSEYTAQTDSVKTVTLQSEIQRARWLQGSGAAGEEVVLEVITHFVGDDSEVEVEVRAKSGGKIENAKGRVWSNRFQHSFTIPGDTTDEISFTANSRPRAFRRLTAAQGVSAEGYHQRPLGPGGGRRGDVVNLLADMEGIPDGTEVKISILEWDRDEAHDPVCGLTALVENSGIEVQWEYQYQADTEDIPSEEELEPVERHYEHPEYLFTVSLGRCRAESGKLLFKDWIELALVGADGAVLRCGSSWSCRMAPGEAGNWTRMEKRRRETFLLAK